MANGIQLDIRVNAETGQLEVLGAKFEGLAKQTDRTQGSFSKLGGESAALLRSLGGFVTAGGIIGFFAQAVKGAEEENEALRRLKGTLEASGQSWEQSSKSVQSWSSAIQNSTRFSDTQALLTLDKLSRSTRNVSEAQSAATIAMNLSVATGKDLSSTTEIVNGLINKQERAVTQAHREFGVFAGTANDAQGILDSLAQSTQNAASNESNLTSETAKMRSAFSEFSDVVGNALAGPLTTLAQWGTAAISRFEQIGLVLGSLAAKFAALFSGDIKTRFAAIDAETEALFNEMERKRTATAETGSQKRVQVTARELETEARTREEAAQKVQQFNDQIDRNMLSLQEDTYRKKIAMIDQEINARRRAVQTTVKDEQTKQQLLARLDAERIARVAEANKLEVTMKRAVALDTMDVAVQTLQVLSTTSEANTKGEIVRAKAILALEKAIAIARILSSPQAALHPGLAAAQIALTVAQFGQQMGAIDKAAQAYNSSRTGFEVSQGLPGGGDLTQVFGPTTGGDGKFSPISSPVGFAGGGGGGGAGVMIDVGGVHISLDVQKLSIDNMPELLLRLKEAALAGTTEAIQAAVAFNRLATKNSGLAV